MGDIGKKSQTASLTRRVINASGTMASTLFSIRAPEKHVNPVIYDLLIQDVEGGLEFPGADISFENAYEGAKKRFNRLRQGFSCNKSFQEQTIGEQFGSVRKALLAYFMEKKWEGGARVAGVLGLSSLVSLNMIWIAQISGELSDSFIKYIQTQANPEMLPTLLEEGAMLAALSGVSAAAIGAKAHMIRWLNRDMTRWIVNSFNKEVLRDPALLVRMHHNQDPDSTDPDKAPDSIRFRVLDAAMDIPSALTGFIEGTWGAFSTSIFVGTALYYNSVPISILDEYAKKLGSYLPIETIYLVPEEAGSFVLAIGALVALSVLNAPAIHILSAKIDDAIGNVSKTSSAFMEKMWHVYEDVESIAASRSHEEASKSLQELIDARYIARAQYDKTQAQFSLYKYFQNVTLSLTAAGPGLAGVMSGNMSFGAFTQNSILLGTIMHNLIYLTNVKPETSRLRKTTQRLVEVAAIIDKARDARSFYQLSGHHAFEYCDNTSEGTAIEVRGLKLLHRGQDAHEKAFVRIDDLKIMDGDKVYVRGASGCGKTSLIRSLNQLWGYGEGSISIRKGKKIFYAEQNNAVPFNISLSELVRYGSVNAGDKVDVLEQERSVIEVLKRSGLFQALDLHSMHEEDVTKVINKASFKGKFWKEVLSGGQKQRLVLARILFQQPDIVFLDEPTSALDKNSTEILSKNAGLEDGQSQFFLALSKGCPNATVVVVMHDDSIVNSRLGYFNKVLSFQSGEIHPQISEVQTPSVLAQGESLHASLS